MQLLYLFSKIGHIWFRYIYLFLFHFRHTIKMKNAIGNEVTVMFLWSREQEDGAKVVRVDNLNNPYKDQPNFDMRFKLTLNKLYAWSLVDYDRVIMLDADNLFLQKTDELFQCGKFCAVFINPCTFHTGLFVLQVNPSSHF
jgi:hypothetical protein